MMVLVVRMLIQYPRPSVLHVAQYLGLTILLLRIRASSDESALGAQCPPLIIHMGVAPCHYIKTRVNSSALEAYREL